MNLEATVDLRVRIENGSVADTVPLAMVRIVTDVEGGQIYFQMTQGDLDNAIDVLSRCRESMEIIRDLGGKH